MENQNKILTISPPGIPLWGVYKYGPNDFGLLPIVTLALVEIYEEGEKYPLQEVRPLSFEADAGVDWWDVDPNFVAYVYEKLSPEELRKRFGSPGLTQTQGGENE